MNLIDLNQGKWLYLIMYLFFPIITLLYLIRSFGLRAREDVGESARRHIEQADYWADIALQMIQSHIGTKSLDSLAHTVQHNLDMADRLLETAVLTENQRQALAHTYNNVTDKLAILTGSQNNDSYHDEPVTFAAQTKRASKNMPPTEAAEKNRRYVTLRSSL